MITRGSPRAAIHHLIISIEMKMLTLGLKYEYYNTTIQYEDAVRMYAYVTTVRPNLPINPKSRENAKRVPVMMTTP
jgi:hypothetical protein